MIQRDDAPISTTDLRKGMSVEVRGSITNSISGTATTVTVEEVVRGPVESKTGSASAGNLLVLGQTVLVDDTTLFDSSVPDFTSIARSALLEVHGARRADGSVLARYLERKTGPVVFSLRGVVAAHSAATQTFTIGALTVNFTAATIGKMPMPSGSNWNGLYVQVRGSKCAGVPVCSTLAATKVNLAGLDLASADEAEIEGFVTNFTSTSDFTVNFQRVLTTPSTIYSGGLQSEIAAGVKLEVEGSLAGGVITATKVSFKDSVKLESNAIATVSTIALEGLPGITVSANALTKIKTTTAATTSDLGPLNNMSLRIRGRASGPSSVIATEIDDRGVSVPHGDVILQGEVTKADVTNPTLKILGVDVNTSLLSPTTDFIGLTGSRISPATFFGALTPNGGLVKAKGGLPASNALVAGPLKEVELED